MAALWPSLMRPPVLEAFYHPKTGVQKDFTMKHCLGEIMGSKAHKMIIQYSTFVTHWDLQCNCEDQIQNFVRKGDFPASQGRKNMETNGQICANSPPPLTLPFSQKGVHSR